MKLKILLKSIMITALMAVSVTLSGSAYHNTQDFSENYDATDSIEWEKSEVPAPKKPEDQITEKTETLQEISEEVTEKAEKVILDVPYINQRQYFPNGCESVSAVMAMQYLGIDITPWDFIANYLDMGDSPRVRNGAWVACDPRLQFPGDPRNSSGWGCYPSVIKNAVDKMELEDYRAVTLKDVSLSTLCSEFIDNGIPVVFWGTIDMEKPSPWITWTIEGTDSTHTWISPFHCLLLVGYDSENYYFNDPWREKCKAYSKEEVEIAYSGVGREALVIVEKA